MFPLRKVGPVSMVPGLGSPHCPAPVWDQMLRPCQLPILQKPWRSDSEGTPDQGIACGKVFQGRIPFLPSNTLQNGEQIPGAF